MKRYKAVIVGAVIFLTLIAIAYSEPSKTSYQERAKRIKLYEPYYYGPRRMDVN